MTLIIKALAFVMSQATKSTLRSIRPLMKWTLRESRSSFAMTSFALCFRQAVRAFSSSGRSERLPLSTSVNSPTSYVYAAVAQEERRMISDRTSRPRGGVKLGGPRLLAINERRQGRPRASRAIAPIFSELTGMSARAVAAELNAREVETPSGAHDGQTTRRRCP